jgi:Tudor domain
LNLDHLEEFYSSLGPNELKETEPSVGLLCVARFVEDQRFYRSQIIDIKGDVAQLLFVDYGNEQDDTPLQDLKRIVPDFLTFPKLVMSPFLQQEFTVMILFLYRLYRVRLKTSRESSPRSPIIRDMKLRALYLEETSRQFFTRPNQVMTRVPMLFLQVTNVLCF